MSVSLRQQVDVALYIIKQKLKGNKHYPLVLMLEEMLDITICNARLHEKDVPFEEYEAKRRKRHSRKFPLRRKTERREKVYEQPSLVLTGKV